MIPLNISNKTLTGYEQDLEQNNGKQQRIQPSPLDPKIDHSSSRQGVIQQEYGNRKASTRSRSELTGASRDLKPKQLALVLITVCLGSMLAMADQTGITMLLTYISDALDAHKSIQWATTGALISSTMFNILVGRFSELFELKLLIIQSFFTIGAFEILSVFATNKVLFHIFRSLSGIGNGGIISLSIVIISKSVDSRKRALYQGILGAAIGFGSCIGPFISTQFVRYRGNSHTGWRQYFTFLGLVFILLGFISLLSIPKYKPLVERQGQRMSEQIDFYGFFFSLSTVILAVIPLNMGGLFWPWKSYQISLCISFSITSFIILIFVEYKNSYKALIPLKFFKEFRICNFMLQTLLVSMIYSSMIFYLPFFYTMVRDYEQSYMPILLLSFLIPIALLSVISAPIIKYIDSFKWVITLGYTLLLIGMVGFICITNTTSSRAANVMLLVLMGIGVGCVFTPLTTGIQSQVEDHDIAVVLSTKCLFKTLGNSLGVAISSVLYSNALMNNLAKHQLSEQQVKYVLSNMTRNIKLSYMFLGDELGLLESIYLSSVKLVFYCWIPIVAICLILSLFIHDKSLNDVKSNQNEKSSTNN